MIDVSSPAERLARLSPTDRAQTLATMTPAELQTLWATWMFWARTNQLAPPGWWRWWALITGRGFGKNRSAAEWLLERAKAYSARGAPQYLALVSRSYSDVRDVMIEGESGLAMVCDRAGVRLKVNRTLPASLEMPELSLSGLSYSAEEPAKMRGPNFHHAWIDEPSVWSGRVDAQGENAFTILDMALRLPPDPRGVATMTPKPVPLVRDLIANESDPAMGVTITRGSTLDNLANLDPGFVRTILARYGGTRLAAQEIEGLLIDEAEGALWKLETLDRHRVDVLPDGLEFAVGIDPPSEQIAECGIVVVGAPRLQRGSTRHAYVVEDASLAGSPEKWASVAVDVAHAWDAPVIAEVNQGGDMVRSTLHTIDPTLRVIKVRATDGKATRAAPIALAYDRGRVHHVGYLGALEAQQVTWVPGEGRSPDRVDALVWAITHLCPPVPLGRGNVSTPARRRRMSVAL